MRRARTYWSHFGDNAQSEREDGAPIESMMDPPLAAAGDEGGCGLRISPTDVRSYEHPHAFQEFGEAGLGI